MAQAIKEQSAYAAVFRALQETAERDAPAWVARLREQALARFEQVGFPTTTEEDWKYTNVAPIARGSFAPTIEKQADDLTPNALAAYTYGEAAQSRLVFVNGRYRSDLSALNALPAGAVVTNLADALTGEHEAVLRTFLARSASIDEHADGFTALNTAFSNQGAFIYLPQGTQLSAPLHLLFLAHETNEPTAIFPRVLVVAESESAATIIESYEATDESGYFTNAVVESFVGTNARVTHYKVQRE